MLEIIKSIFLPFEEVPKKTPENQLPEVFRLKGNLQSDMKVSGHPELPDEVIADFAKEHLSFETVPYASGNVPPINQFFTFLEASGRSRNTVFTYRYAYQSWSKWASQRKTSVYSLSFRDIESALAGKDTSTSRKLLSMLKSYSKWLMKSNKARLFLELQKVTSPKIKQRIAKHKSAAMFAKIGGTAKELCANGDRKGIWIGLMLFCGLRISEIQTAESGDNFVQVIGKGNKERRVPAPEWLLEAMRKCPKRDDGGWQKHRNIIDFELRKKCGLSKLHSLRHTYATLLLHKGLLIDEIQKLLGHNEINTTQIYAKTKMPEGVIPKLESLMSSQKPEENKT